MGTKEFLGQKLPYMTNPQKKYLEKIQIPLDGYQNRVQEELNNLERPEASWTLTDLIASGAQFPSTLMGRNHEHTIFLSSSRSRDTFLCDIM